MPFICKQIYILMPGPSIPSYFSQNTQLLSFHSQGQQEVLPNSVSRSVSFPLLGTGRAEVGNVKSHHQKLVKGMLLRLDFKMRFHTKTTQQAVVSYYSTLNSIIQPYYKVKWVSVGCTSNQITIYNIFSIKISIPSSKQQTF